MNEENGGGKISVWIWLIPLYILVAIPLVRWTMKLYSPDIDLSRDEMSAFSGQADTPKNNFKFHEPNLSDLGFAVNYKGHGSSLKEETEGAARPASEEEKSFTKEKPRSSASARKTSVKEEEAPVKQPRGADPVRRQEMMSVGFKKGFLTASVGKLLNNPKAVSALFNNSYVVNGFMARDTVKNVLSSPESIENFLTKSPAVSNFLGNSVVQSALKNQEILKAVAGSQMSKDILALPAVESFLQNPDMINEVITENPQLAALLADPNVNAALMNNPQTAVVLAGMQKKK